MNRYYRVELSFREQPDFTMVVKYVGNEPTKDAVVRRVEAEAHRYGYHGRAIKPTVRLLQGSALVAHLRERELPYYERRVKDAEFAHRMGTARNTGELLASARKHLAECVAEIRAAVQDAERMNGEVAS